MGERATDHNSRPGALLECRGVESQRIEQLALLRVGQGAEWWIRVVPVHLGPQDGTRLLAATG
jgi:hypothetical protein